MRYPVKKMAEVCRITMGQSPESHTYNIEGHGLPFFQGKAEFGHVYPEVVRYCSDPRKIAEADSVLLSVRAPVGAVNIAKERCCIGRGLAAIEAVAHISHCRYIFYYLRSIETILANQGVGSTFTALGKKDIEGIEIPLPPLETQQRIANVLDKAQELIDKRKRQLEMLDEFLQSVFLDMFGDPVINPMGWTVVPVIEVCDCIVPGRDKPKSFSGNIPWVTTADLNRSYYTYKSRDNTGLTLEEINQVSARIIPKESVLLTCVGDLGITSIAGEDMVINQQLHSFQCSERINNKYLKWMLCHRKDYMLRMATSTTVPYLNKDKCNSIPIMLPPLQVQEYFAREVDKTEQQKRLMQQSLLEMENAFNSIMQKAFKGELFS